MLNIKRLTQIFGTCSLFLYTITSPATSSNNLTKDEWFIILQQLAPANFCKGLTDYQAVNKQLSKANIDVNKCLTLLPVCFNKCKSKYYSEIPRILNQKHAAKWEGQLNECIAEDMTKSQGFVN